MLAPIVNYLSRNMWSILLVIATIMGAFGGFPQPPKIFQRLSEYQLVQWFLVFVLAYQGGAGQNSRLALLSTLAIFVVYQIILYFEPVDEMIYL
jgi:hypothetical protein